MVTLWTISKRFINIGLVEKEIADTMGYAAKISEYETKIKSIKDSEKEAAITYATSIDQVRKKLRKHAEVTYQEGLPFGLGDKFYGFRVEPLDIGLFKKNITKKYTEVMGTDISQEARQFLFSRMVDLETIQDPKMDPNKEKRQAEQNINDLVSEREAYMRLLQKKVADECELRAKINFLGKLKDSSLLVVKTDLNGEASVILPMGEYYIFGWAEIGENFIAWNYGVSIAEDEQYIELSNDNAYSFAREDVAGLMKILAERPK
jgi:hypothetical protein